MFFLPFLLFWWSIIFGKDIEHIQKKQDQGIYQTNIENYTMITVTHELISEEWEKDYPNPKSLKDELQNLRIITLTLENKINKYWNYYYAVEKQIVREERELKKAYKLLKLYYLKKLPDEVIEENGLEHLNISYNKTEIEMLIKAHDKYCSVEENILLNKSLKERIKECVSFISKWRYHQKDFIEMLKINNGLIR